MPDGRQRVTAVGAQPALGAPRVAVPLLAAVVMVLTAVGETAAVHAAVWCLHVSRGGVEPPQPQREGYSLLGSPVPSLLVRRRGVEPRTVTLGGCWCLRLAAGVSRNGHISQHCEYADTRKVRGSNSHGCYAHLFSGQRPTPSIGWTFRGRSRIRTSACFHTTSG